MKMYVNPFEFGVFIGVIGTVVVEIILVAVIVYRGNKL